MWKLTSRRSSSNGAGGSQLHHRPLFRSAQGTLVWWEQSGDPGLTGKEESRPPSASCSVVLSRHLDQVGRTIHRKLREIQNEWWTNLFEKSQHCADIGDYRGFHDVQKAEYGPLHQVQSPLRRSNGQKLLTEKASVLNQLLEHFQTLFNPNHTVQVLCRITQLPERKERDEFHTLVETIKAIKQLKSGKVGMMEFHQRSGSIGVQRYT